MNTWLEIAKMEYSRRRHAIGVINESLWITGGEGGYNEWGGYSDIYSTEYLYSNGFIKSGSDLPNWHKRHAFSTKLESSLSHIWLKNLVLLS